MEATEFIRIVTAGFLGLLLGMLIMHAACWPHMKKPDDSE